MTDESQERSSESASAGKAEAPAMRKFSKDENPLHHPMWEKVHPEKRDRMAAFHVVGHLLYWAGTGLAVLGFLLAVLSLVGAPDNIARPAGLVIAAVVIWGVGRMFRYLLSGK